MRANRPPRGYGHRRWVRTYERCRAALEELGLRISQHWTSPGRPATFEPASAAPPSRRPARLREERKVVSVLFAEVVAPGAGLQGRPRGSARDRERRPGQG